MQLQNFSSNIIKEKNNYHEIAVISDSQDKLLKIKNLLHITDLPVYLFLVGNATFRQEVDKEIIFLENISKIEQYFPCENNRIYLACFE